MSSPYHAGTVTFLFTDIEGSTKLLQGFGADYASVVADHRRILREAFGGAGGREVDTQGDALFHSFQRARDGVTAAVDGQRALAGHEWPHGARVRVRMGLHTGEPAVGDEGPGLTALGLTTLVVFLGILVGIGFLIKAVFF